MTLTIVIFIVAVALFFDFINGFHDSANSIATVVTTRVLSPRNAVIWAAFWNFVAFFATGTGVATVIQKTLSPAVANSETVLATLIGAITWNLLTWYFGIPSSSSHALIGGLLGAGLAAGGFKSEVITWTEAQRSLIGIVLAPTLCLGLGFVFMLSILWICRKMHPAPINRTFKVLQLVSSGVYSFAHGGNDAQKTMGVIAFLLLGHGYMTKEEAAAGHIPGWVALCAYMAISLGTLSGGWRIVKTMGSKITKLRPVDGFASETAGGVIIIGLTHWLKMPISTTHAIAGAIMGVGSTKGLSAVRWGISARIVWAWVLTIPASASVAILSYWLVHGIVRLFNPS